MHIVSRLGKSWTESWRSPGRARKQYALVAIAFGLLTVVAIGMQQPVVASLGAVMTVIVAALAYFAPRLVERTRTARDDESE